MTELYDDFLPLSILFHHFYFIYRAPSSFSLFFFSFILISWRLITLQHCSGSCHTFTWISYGFSCVPHPELPFHLPLHPIPLGHPSAHQPWALVSCIQPGLAICFTLDNIHVSMLFSERRVFFFFFFLSSTRIGVPHQRGRRVIFSWSWLSDQGPLSHSYLQELCCWPLTTALQVWDELSQGLALLDQLDLSFCYDVQPPPLLLLQLLQLSLLLFVQDAPQLIKLFLDPVSFRFHLILKEQGKKRGW